MNGNEFNQDHNTSSSANDSGDETTMPLGIGSMENDDAIVGTDAFGDTGDAGKRTFNSGALLLVAVVAIAAAGLFSMRTLTRATASVDLHNEAEKSIESFLSMLQSTGATDETGQPIGAEEAAVLDVLNESYASRQVALTNVQRNPFIIFEEQSRPDTPARPQGPDPIIQQRKDRLTLFEQAAGRLELRSVLMGDTPLATINSHIVQVGASVIAEPEGVSFKVLSISNDGVVIFVEDAKLDVRYRTTLTMDRDRNRRSAPPRSNQSGQVRPR